MKIRHDIYEYNCNDCGHIWDEEDEGFTIEPECPQCYSFDVSRTEDQDEEE